MRCSAFTGNSSETTLLHTTTLLHSTSCGGHWLRRSRSRYRADHPASSVEISRRDNHSKIVLTEHQDQLAVLQSEPSARERPAKSSQKGRPTYKGRPIASCQVKSEMATDTPFEFKDCLRTSTYGLHLGMYGWMTLQFGYSLRRGSLLSL